MKSKFLAALASIVVILGAALAPATSAQAAMSDCTNGNFCTWTNTNYGGTRWEWSPGTILTLPGGCLNVTTSAKNNQSSMYNRAGLINTRLTMHSGANCTGVAWEVTTGMSDSNFVTGNPIFSFDNTMESIRAQVI